jgi:hypothetical protein
MSMSNSWVFCVCGESYLESISGWVVVVVVVKVEVGRVGGWVGGRSSTLDNCATGSTECEDGAVAGSVGKARGSR